MINQLLDTAKENDIALEIYKEREKNTSIKVFDDQIDSFDFYDIKSYKIKAIYQKKTINIITENIDDPDRIIQLIKKHASIIDNDDLNELAMNQEKIENKSISEELDFQQVEEDMIKLNDLKKQYPNLTSIISSFGKVEKEIGIYNTLNTKLEDSNNYIWCMADIVLNFDGDVKTEYKYYYAKEYDQKRFYEMVKELIENTISKHNASSVATKRYNILLDSKCVADLLLHFSFIYHAESINKNQSILSGKFSQKVFSDKITIVEDPANDQYIGKRLFDDEGTKTYYKEIVQNGTFVTKLYDNKTAIKDHTKSTGNSFGVRNMYIVPGKFNKNQLLEKLKDGIYITCLDGLHAGINDTTGDISLKAEGYIIQNGKKQRALNMIILSTNIFELFGNIVEIGNDLEMVGSSGGAPSLLISHITIAGNQ